MQIANLHQRLQSYTYPEERGILGRSIRTEKKGFGGQMILTDTEYNPKGQLSRISDPYFAGDAIVWAETYPTYDNYGRLTTINRITGRNTTFEYPTNRVKETTAGKVSWKDFDSQGLITLAHDNGGDITYTFFPDGKVKSILAPSSVLTSMEYNDAARNQTKLTDPSAGTINYTYDSFGRVLTQKDARSKLTTYTYYPDGRINTKVTPEGTTTYAYNTNKQLTGISQPNAVSRTYGYDTQGRATSISETITGRATPFLTTFVFDSYGRLSILTHPSGIVETRGYNTRGYMETISAGGSVRYTVTGMNARQQLTAANYGSTTPLPATYGFDAYGYPTLSQVGSVQDYRYSIDPVTGNMISRQNYKKSKLESFTYDNLDRLLKITDTQNPLQNLTMTYTDNGNLTTKSDIGTTAFTYGINAGPYALTGVTSSTSPNIIPAVPQTISYNSFGKVSYISEANGSQTIQASFVYNSDNQRARMTVGVYYGAEIMTRYYVGGSYMLEVQPNTSNEYTYLGGDAYTAPVVVHNARGVVSYYYLLRDHLGNITHLINTSNSLVAEYSFDAWGRRRNATNWTYTLDANDKALFADRGFTGHEYLPWFNLYNMNGRLYDPLIGRFLSADPVIQNAGNTQNYNRYSYCLNNPLKFTDPSGYIFEMQDLPPDTEQISAAGEFYSKFSGQGQSFDFSSIGGNYNSGGSLDVIGTLFKNLNGGSWSPSTGFVFFSEGLISSIIFTGSRDNHFERLRGVLYADGTEVYYSDGGSLDGNPNIGAWSYNLYSESETNAFLGFIAGIAGGELLGGLEIGNLVNGLFAKSGTETIQYTKSSLSLGREMHAGYKLAEHAPELGRFKEFGKILGIRPDFVDFSTKTIYELKPFNPRAMQQGVLQLNKYQSIFEQRFGGVWNTILDTY